MRLFIWSWEEVELMFMGFRKESWCLRVKFLGDQVFMLIKGNRRGIKVLFKGRSSYELGSKYVIGKQKVVERSGLGFIFMC